MTDLFGSLPYKIWELVAGNREMTRSIIPVQLSYQTDFSIVSVELNTVCMLFV